MQTWEKIVLGIVIVVVIIFVLIISTFLLLSILGISLVKQASENMDIGYLPNYCDTINVKSGLPVRNYRRGIFNSRWIPGPYMCAGYWKPRLGTWNYPPQYYSM